MQVACPLPALTSGWGAPTKYAASCQLTAANKTTLTVGKCKYQHFWYTLDEVLFAAKLG